MEKLKIAFSNYLSIYFRQEISVSDICEIPGGFLSKAYILSCHNASSEFQLFSRTINSNRGGYVYPIDRYRAFTISDQMYRNASMDVSSHGVMIYENEEYTTNMNFSDHTMFFHIQDYRKGDSYMDDYFALENKSALGLGDIELLEKIATKIA